MTTDQTVPHPPGSGAMFDQIAPRYDLLNRIISLGRDRSWRRRTVRTLMLGERARVLDVATGTADLAIEIVRAHPGAHVVGIDPSAEMLAIGRDKIAKRGFAEHIELTVGDAQALSYAACEFDAATIAFGIRNVPDRPRALREMARVVRPGGRVAVLELGEPSNAVARFHAHRVVPRIGGWLSGKREYAYLQRSVAAFPPAHEFAATMTECGLRVVDMVAMTFGACTLYTAEVA
jgi:demethylmenaquinone methyltransferase/2-methoxy-6-polyprenyl-1,4-benzoquinol methylase